MKSWWVKLPALAVLGLALYFGNVEVQSWLGRRALQRIDVPMLALDDALAAAGARQKYVLADLSAIWCPACRKLDREVLGNAQVQQDLRARFVFARLEYESDAGRAFAERYGLRGFPNLLVLDADGNVVKRLPITFDPEEFRRNLPR